MSVFQAVAPGVFRVGCQFKIVDHVVLAVVIAVVDDFALCDAPANLQFHQPHVL
jgi:hypothetical protein